jgi:hypothetical protein
MLLTAVMAPALKSHLATTMNLKENNVNFGVTIYLKSRFDRPAEKRYMARLDELAAKQFYY